MKLYGLLKREQSLFKIINVKNIFIFSNPTFEKLKYCSNDYKSRDIMYLSLRALQALLSINTRGRIYKDS